MIDLRDRPLRQQLVLAIVFLLAPILAAAAWLGRAEYRETVEELGYLADTTAQLTAIAVDRELTGFDRLAQTLVVHPSLQRLDPSAADVLEPQRAQRPALLDLVLLDTNGALVASGGDGTLSHGWSQQALRVRDAGARVVGPLRLTAAGVPYVTVAYPVRDDTGAIAGVLVCQLASKTLQGVFRQSLLPLGSVITLTESDGRVLARKPETPPSPAGVLRVQLADAIGPAGSHDDIDGVRRMFRYAAVPGAPWTVTVGIPTSEALGRTGALWLRTLPALGVVFAGWVLVVLSISRRLSASLGHLEAAAQRIGGGDFTPLALPPMATRELARLQSTFDQMVRRVNEARAALDAQMAEERRMRQEVESLQRQVIRQERLAAVGQLVSGVAHEINNPLQAILGFSELLQMQGNVPESAKADLLLIQKESARACGIIRNLAMFARQQTGDAEPVRVGDIVRAVAELRLRRLESEGIELWVDDESQRHVLAVAAELQQVVLNFVVNAEQSIVQSGRQPGRITARTRDEGDAVLLEVEDTGPGVDPEHEAKLFQPFFTTKAVGQGTGLGLSVSYGIIDSLGGRIGYRSAPGGGAVFYFALPAAAI